MNTTPQPRLNALSIVVADMGAALDFYRRCGLTFADDADAAPHAETVVAGDFRIMFDTVASIEAFMPGSTPPKGGHSTMALAFECATPAAVDDVHNALVDAGHPSSLVPFDAVWGQRYAAVTDPDGHVVDFYCSLTDS